MIKRLRPLWVSFSLSSLFFYPLTMSLFGKWLYFMNWSILNTLELASVFIILTLILSLIIFFVESIKNKIVKSILIAIIAFFPLVFFFIHLARQFIDKGFLIFVAEYIFSLYGLLFFVSLGAFLIYKKIVWVSKFYEMTISLILALIPLSLATIFIVIINGFGGHVDAVGEIDSLAVDKSIAVKRGNVFVFLFDELDYSILYNEDGKVHAKYSNLHEFSQNATNYHDARAPGRATLISMPQILLGRKEDNIRTCQNNLCSGYDKKPKIMDTSKSIFSLAKKHDFKTAFIGWAHNYCEQFNGPIDYCRSYGIYNYSSFRRDFSFLNPIFTNINMLPHQMPFGLLKNPVYSNMHRNNAMRVYDLNLKLIKKGKDNQLFNFTHYALPHSPFVFKKNGFNPGLRPFEQNLENYEEQLLFVDKLFGDLISEIKRTGQFEKSKMVLLSDHGFRYLSDPESHNHVPAIVFNGDNPKKLDIFDQINVEEILVSILQGNADSFQ